MLHLLRKYYAHLVITKKQASFIEDYSLDADMLSDMGCVRKRNEDSVAIVQLNSKNKMAPGLLAIVADGMGGHKAGNRASELAVSIIRDVICATVTPSKKVLEEAVQAANLAIFNEASLNADCVGMGTTVTALLLFEGQAWMAHVGDSRLYRLRKKALIQLSEDHTLVAGMERNGFITAEQAKTHPDRNVLDRAMGIHLSLEIMIARVDLSLGDIFLLCSDGLHDLVSPEEIREKLVNYSLQASCNLLVDLARCRGGYDNISVVAVRCDKQSNLLLSSPLTRDAVITSNA
jgi:protein phosphatase